MKNQRVYTRHAQLRRRTFWTAGGLLLFGVVVESILGMAQTESGRYTATLVHFAW